MHTNTVMVYLNYIFILLANRVDLTQVTQFKRNQVEPILRLWPLSHNSRALNDSQLYSIMLAIKNKFQLIQGPPGL